jgi:hypothetical protein
MHACWTEGAVEILPIVLANVHDQEEEAGRLREFFARGKIQLLTLLLRRADDGTSVDIIPNDTQLGLVIRPQFAFVHESLELISRYW